MNIRIEKIIGGNIKMLREEANMTQEGLATKLQVNGCDITRSAVAKIEVGQRHIYADEIILLARIFGVEYEKLLSIEPENQK